MCVLRVRFSARHVVCSTGSVLGKARKSCSVYALWNNEKDMRTVKPLRENAGKLRGSKLTRADGVELDAYVVVLSAAWDLKHADFADYTMHELEEKVTLVATENVEWPHDIAIRLLERSNKHFLKHRMWADIMKSCKPWPHHTVQTVIFDPCAPQLCDFSWKPMAYRLQYCMTWMFAGLLRST